MTDSLKVKMFGEFSVSYRGNDNILDRAMTSKTTQLMQIIAMYASEGITKSSLINLLYGRDEVENANGSLNNTLFRLRKRLKAAGLPDSSYILIQNGICKWDPEIPLEVDCRVFEDLILQGRREQDKATRMHLFMTALEQYSGEYLKDMIGEEWVAINNCYFHNMFQESMEELANWLMSESKYDTLLQMSTNAARIYPFESWQVWQIDSLVAMGMYKDAIDVYEKTTKRFFDEMQLPPSAELLERINYIGRRITVNTQTIKDIRQTIEENVQKGAYFCTLPSFVDSYRVVERLKDRVDLPVVFMLCTIRNGEGRPLENNQRTNDISELYQKAIENSLRKGDFFTKYNGTQFLILLVGLGKENYQSVSGRIDRAFNQSIPYGKYTTEYYVISMEEVESLREKGRGRS